jgi:hypothetical protein
MNIFHSHRRSVLGLHAYHTCYLYLCLIFRAGTDPVMHNCSCAELFSSHPLNIPMVPCQKHLMYTLYNRAISVYGSPTNVNHSKEGIAETLATFIFSLTMCR